MADRQEDSAVPASQQGSWMSFLSSLTKMTGDLYSMTAPPWILSPVSLTEFPAYWLERPELFAAIADGVDAEDRAIRVLRWFIATLKGQYTSRNEKMGSEKKPLNPVLGELFVGTWPDKNGRGETTLTVEQVSHHPPITAYYIANASKGLSLQGHNAQKTRFNATSFSIGVDQVGHAILSHTLKDGSVEKYLITLPTLRIEGLMKRPYVELAETSYIQSSTGYTSVVDYKGKGYFSGKSHSYKGVLSVGPTQLLVAEGQWDTTSKVTAAKTKHAKVGDIFTDVTSPKEEVTVRPLEEQSEWETRKLWGKVANGIRSGDYDTASKEKTKIEEEQRQRRRDETAAKAPWQLKHFVHVDNDPDYDAVVGALKGKVGVLPTEDGYIYRAPQA